MRELLDFLEAKARLAAKSQAARRRADPPGADMTRTPRSSSARQGALGHERAEHLEALLKNCYEVGKVADCPPDIVKPRLVRAVRTFGYEVREAEPLSASRGGRGEAASDTSAGLFDHLTSLRIELQPLGANQTLLTFSYVVKRAAELTRLDRQALELEAGLMIALISSPAAVQSEQCLGRGVLG